MLRRRWRLAGRRVNLYDTHLRDTQSVLQLHSGGVSALSMFYCRISSSTFCRSTQAFQVIITSTAICSQPFSLQILPKPKYSRVTEASSTNPTTFQKLTLSQLENEALRLSRALMTNL